MGLGHLSAHKRTVLVKAKIELDSHADACVVGDHSLIVHDHKQITECL